MLPPPPSDPQVISLRERLPDVDHAITDRILKGAFTAAELPLLLPADMRPQLRAWQTRLHGTGASTSISHGKEDSDFPPFGHLTTAFTMYIAVLSFFCPPASSVDLVINMTRYLAHLLHHNETHTSPAVWSFHMHFHNRLIAQRVVYNSASWAERDLELISHHILPYHWTQNLEPSWKRSYQDLKLEASQPATQATTASGSSGNLETTRQPRRCIVWNQGGVCPREPNCQYAHLCMVPGCSGGHRMVEHSAAAGKR